MNLSLLYLLPLAQGVTEHITEHPEEIGVIGTIIAIAGGIIKVWYDIYKTKREASREREDRLRLESKMEADTDGTLAGSSNPGRTTAQLIEVVHEDLKEFKRETNTRLNQMTSDVGRIMGKLDMK